MTITAITISTEGIFILIGVLAALIALFVTVFKHQDINHALFHRYFDDYTEAMDTLLVIISVIGGAILGIIYLFDYKYHGDIEPMILLGVACILLAIIVSASIFQSIILSTNKMAIILKGLFMFCMCTFAIAAGAIAAIVIIAVVIFLICALIVGLIVGHTFFYDKVISVGGIFKKNVMDIGGGRYKDSAGNIYEEID